MREGKWVVFKDIDRGSPEVLGVIKPLAESLELGKWIGGRAKLDVPSHGTVAAHDSFRLFSTRSSLPSKVGIFSPPTFFGSHKFSEVFLRTPSSSELNFVVGAKFHRLDGKAAEAIIQVWEDIRQMGPSTAGREVGLKDLLKFSGRIDALLLSHELSDILMEDGTLTLMDIFPNPSVREDIFMEARDVFFGFCTPTPASRAHCVAVARLIGQHLGLDLERQQWVLDGKLPQFEVEKDSNGRVTAVRAGRTRMLTSSDKPTGHLHAVRPFTMHKPALCLISRIATAVSHSEPVLLTGETGTGKTSVITHLASLLQRPLVSLNLSHQTESSDLIGGLKPIDARIPAATLQEKFVGIFAATFSRRKNEKFETEIRKAVNDCKWKRAVGLWKEAVRLAVERIQAKEAPE
jgi:midasin